MFCHNAISIKFDPNLLKEELAEVLISVSSLVIIDLIPIDNGRMVN